MNWLQTIAMAGLWLALYGTSVEVKTNVTKQLVGKMPDGTPIDLYALADGRIEARIMNYGGYLVSLKVPDRSGKLEDVVLGFDTLDQYVTNNYSNNTAFLGPLVGRYANRIAHGSFTLDGRKYSLPLNNGENSLHGGPHGFHNQVWKAKSVTNGVELSYLSKDREEGYPGDLSVVVRYTLTDGALRIEYSATTDKPTVLNLTSHSYFNLAGQGQGNILDHRLTLHASRFTPVDANLIPTGELREVASTPLDFRKSTRIGERIDADNEQLHLGKGYDHNWVLDKKGRTLAEAAEVYEPTSGRVLKVLTTEPGIQFYSGNFLDGTIKGKGGTPYVRRSGLCLETQHFPESPNHPNFPSTELKPGEHYHSVTVYSFSSR
jgi:aldose 1-epimerase